MGLKKSSFFTRPNPDLEMVIAREPLPAGRQGSNLGLLWDCRPPSRCSQWLSAKRFSVSTSDFGKENSEKAFSVSQKSDTRDNLVRVDSDLAGQPHFGRDWKVAEIGALCPIPFAVGEIDRNYFTNGQILTRFDIFVILPRKNQL